MGASHLFRHYQGSEVDRIKYQLITAGPAGPVPPGACRWMLGSASSAFPAYVGEKKCHTSISSHSVPASGLFVAGSEGGLDPEFS